MIDTRHKNTVGRKQKKQCAEENANKKLNVFNHATNNGKYVQKRIY